MRDETDELSMLCRSDGRPGLTVRAQIVGVKPMPRMPVAIRKSLERRSRPILANLLVVRIATPFR